MCKASAVLLVFALLGQPSVHSISDMCTAGSAYGKLYMYFCVHCRINLQYTVLLMCALLDQLMFDHISLCTAVSTYV